MSAPHNTQSANNIIMRNQSMRNLPNNPPGINFLPLREIDDKTCFPTIKGSFLTRGHLLLPPSGGCSKKLEHVGHLAHVRGPSLGAPFIIGLLKPHATAMRVSEVCWGQDPLPCRVRTCIIIDSSNLLSKGKRLDHITHNNTQFTVV